MHILYFNCTFAKKYMDIDKLNKNIIEYCKLNDISDIENFKFQCLLKGFNIEKYGMSPQDNLSQQVKVNQYLSSNNDLNIDISKENIVKKRKIKVIQND